MTVVDLIGLSKNISPVSGSSTRLPQTSVDIAWTFAGKTKKRTPVSETTDALNFMKMILALSPRENALLFPTQVGFP